LSVSAFFFLAKHLYLFPFYQHVTTEGMALVKHAEDAASNKKVYSWIRYSTILLIPGWKVYFLSLIIDERLLRLGSVCNIEVFIIDFQFFTKQLRRWNGNFQLEVHSDFFIQISVHCRQDMVLELLSWQFYAFITSLTCDFLLLKLWIVVCFWPFFSPFYIIMSTGREKGYCWYSGAGDSLNFKILI